MYFIFIIVFTWIDALKHADKIFYVIYLLPLLPVELVVVPVWEVLFCCV